jgi:hypothetical protein
MSLIARMGLTLASILATYLIGTWAVDNGYYVFVGLVFLAWMIFYAWLLEGPHDNGS